MSDKFHSIECALRHNGMECTCGWDELKKQEEQETLRKKSNLKKGESAIKELIYDALSKGNTAICHLAEEEYAALVYTGKGKEALQELVRMARVIARAYIYETGVDNAPKPDEQTDEIVDMAFKVLEGSWIARTYTGDKK